MPEEFLPYNDLVEQAKAQQAQEEQRSLATHIHTGIQAGRDIFAAGENLIHQIRNEQEGLAQKANALLHDRPEYHHLVSISIVAASGMIPADISHPHIAPIGLSLHQALAAIWSSWRVSLNQGQALGSTPVPLVDPSKRISDRIYPEVSYHYESGGLTPDHSPLTIKPSHVPLWLTPMQISAEVDKIALNHIIAKALKRGINLYLETPPLLRWKGGSISFAGDTDISYRTVKINIAAVTHNDGIALPTTVTNYTPHNHKQQKFPSLAEFIKFIAAKDAQSQQTHQPIF